MATASVSRQELMDKLAQWAYWILGILIVGTMCYILYTKFNKQVAAVLTFLISMLALYYYYVKWFIVGDAYQEGVTVCPDFMSVLKTFDTKTNQFVCYDSANVYKSGTVYNNKNDALSAFNALQKTSSSGEITGGFAITPDITNTTSVSNFCSSLKSAGMSWISFCKNIGA